MVRLPRARWGLCCLALLALIRPALAEEALEIKGTRVLPESHARAVTGNPPPERAAREAWARAATDRLVEAYNAKGYQYARAWFQLLPDGTVQIEVDEGRMRVMFTGTGSISAFLYQVDLNLPGGVFHKPALERAMDELKTKHDLLNAYYRVREPPEYVVTALGEVVRRRVLQIYIVRRDVVGWAFNISFSSSWGVLPSVDYERGNLLWEDDRFRGKLEVAFPMRAYLLDKDPKFVWVHGGLELSYRPPRFWRRRLGVRLDTGLWASRFERLDLGAENYHLLRSISLASLMLYIRSVETGLGYGVDIGQIFGVERLPEAEMSIVPDSATSIRPLLRAMIRWDPVSEVLRRDLRSFLELRADIITADEDEWMVELVPKGQLFVVRGRHRFNVRGRGVLLTGNVPFWDEEPLAGSYQRVFFSDRYWVHEALQLEVAYRVMLGWEWFELGVFHDGSLFRDRSGSSSDVAFANAFGPSAHFLLFDLFSLGIYVGFGFAPVGFDHTFSFGVQTVF